MRERTRFCRKVVLIGAALALAFRARAQVRIIELVADSDSRYKIAGQHHPEITVRAGEQVLLRVTARRGKTWNRDGSIHGFTLLRAKDRSKVEGWSLLFKPGTQEFQMTAPAEPGDYEVVCTVICSEDHEGMNMKFTVLP
jgi:heme/copper-type cytochrome/quinol oxidase subunit 2